MSYTFESQEHHIDTFGVETSSTTVLSIRELSDAESEALLSGIDIGSLSSNLLRSPPLYVVSDSDDEDEDDEDDETIDPIVAAMVESGLEPGLQSMGDIGVAASRIHEALIEMLDDGEDDVMLQEDEDQLLSSSAAEIIEADDLDWTDASSETHQRPEESDEGVHFE